MMRPEFSVTAPDFSPPACAQGLREAGAALVRGAISPADLAPFARATQRVFDRIADEPERCEGWQHELYEEYGCVLPYVMDGAFGSDLTSVLALVRHGAAYPILSAYFGTDELVAALGQMLVRHIVPRPGMPCTWHQDGTAVEFTGLITVWLPLSACGRTSPSLQVAMNRYGRLLESADIPRPDAPEMRDAIWRLCYLPGDAMMFDPYMVRGTHLADVMIEPRYSVEVRVCREDEASGWSNDRTHFLYSFKRGDVRSTQ